MAKRVRSSLLRQSVLVQTPTVGRGTSGQPTTTWAGYKRWSQIEPLRGEELTIAKQNNERITHRVILRRDNRTKTLKAKDRILHGTRALYVEGVTNVDERNSMLEIMCREAIGN